MNYDRIPVELRRLRQWVCWRPVPRGSSKLMKIPVQPNGQPADSTDASTWATFEQCVQAAERFSGIGFMLNDGYVGIDLDKVRDLQTGATEEWARDVIRELNSYTELSQSGTGWHVIVRGKLAGAGNKKGRMEMYDSDRFFVMTGQHAARTPSEIQTRDITDLQRRMLAGLDPKPVEPLRRTGGSRDGDESAKDYRIISSTIRRLHTCDAKLIESEIKQRFPERYVQRAELKGYRGSVGYWTYSVRRALERNAEDRRTVSKGLPSELSDSGGNHHRARGDTAAGEM